MNFELTPEMIEEMREVLSPREYDIIARNYGIDGKKMTLRKLAKEYKLSGTRIGQIRETGLNKLRHRWRKLKKKQTKDIDNRPFQILAKSETGDQFLLITIKS